MTREFPFDTEEEALAFIRGLAEASGRELEWGTPYRVPYSTDWWVFTTPRKVKEEQQRDRNSDSV